MLPLSSASPWILLSLLALLVGCDRSRPNRGKFNLKDGMQCTWVTKNVSAVVNLKVTCENPVARVHGGVTDIECEYRAKPQSCPGYQSNTKGYYKQVSRALKKLQDKLCYDQRALVKNAMCKRAPREAHFKLDIRTSVTGAQSGGDPMPMPTRTGTATNGSISGCKGRTHDEMAQEYCSSSWTSMCAFFFSMLQSNDC